MPFPCLPSGLGLPIQRTGSARLAMLPQLQLLHVEPVPFGALKFAFALPFPSGAMYTMLLLLKAFRE